MNSRRLYCAHMLMSLIPPTRLFGFKRLLIKWCGAKIAGNVRIVSTARFYINGNLSIGSDTWIGHEVLIAGGKGGDVIIGSKVDIAPRVSIITGSHHLFTEPNRAAGTGYSTPIVIEDGVWLGAASTILGGVTIGKCSVVAAGALVNRNVHTRTKVAGVPARKIPNEADEGNKFIALRTSL